MGKNRLAPSGYYVSYVYRIGGADPWIPKEFSLIYIDPNLTAKYIHYLWGTAWCTLSWVSAPTKKSFGLSQIRKGRDGYVTVQEHYLTHADLLASRFAANIAADYPGGLVPA